MRTAHELDAIRWHLENNFIQKLNEKEIARVLTLCEDLNAGRAACDSYVGNNASLTVGEVLTFYHIEITD